MVFYFILSSKSTIFGFHLVLFFRFLEDTVFLLYFSMQENRIVMMNFRIHTKSILISSSNRCKLCNRSRCRLFFVIASLHRSSMSVLLRNSWRCLRAVNSFSICLDVSLSRLHCCNVVCCSDCFLSTLLISFRISKSKQKQTEKCCLKLVILTEWMLLVQQNGQIRPVQMPSTLCPFFIQFDPFLRPLHTNSRVAFRWHIQKW